jgi:hypothetical protein
MDFGPKSRLQAMDRATGGGNRRLLFVALSLVLFIAAALVLHASIVHAGEPASNESLTQQSEVFGGDSAEPAGKEARFGSSVALSSSSGTLLVGATGDDDERGAAWVFAGSEQKWGPTSVELTPGTLPASAEACTGTRCEECAEELPLIEEDECAFGASVALSADGNTALVGNPTGNSSPGAAWVFTHGESGWTRSAMLSGTNVSGEGRFGKSVALSADGNIALIGDPSATNGRGAAWLFEREGSSWKQIAQLSNVAAGSFAHFGRSVALSGDGSLALIGAPGVNNYTGAAWTYVGSGSTWTQQANPLTEEGAQVGDHFGKSVALSSDGSTALIGALDAVGGRGSVSPFVSSAGGFEAQGPKLVGPETELHFGASVALEGDGDAALVGAPRATSNGGTVSVLSRGSGWSVKPEKLAASNEKSRSMFGAAVALSRDGMVAAIGSPRDSASLGAAWVFAKTPASQVPAPIVGAIEPRTGPAAGGTSVTISGENLGEAEQVTFGGVPATGVSSASAAEITAVTPAGVAGRKVEVVVKAHGQTSTVKGTFVYEAASSGDPKGAVGGTTSKTASIFKLPSGGVAGFRDSAGATCAVGLRKKALAVTRYRTVALRLVRSGAGACRGKLAISYRTRARGRGYMLRTIGTASFSLTSGTSRVVQVKLTKAGVAWFRAHHGKANASLAIARVVPGPVTASTASVRLNLKKPAKHSHSK